MMLIDTTEEDKELWNWIGFLRDERNARRLIARRIANGFFLKRLPTTLPALTLRGVNQAARRVASSIRQAEELWHAAGSDGVSPVSQPILLFYGAESLAAALIFATFDTPQHASTHGLRSRQAHRVVEVESSGSGLFGRFHECYSADNRIYGTTWTLKQLLSVNIEIYPEFFLAYGSRPHINLSASHIDPDAELNNQRDYAKPYVRGGKRLPLHPLDYRFLTLFVISNFARYEPTDWLHFLEEPPGFATRAFLSKTYRRFPNLFLDIFWGDRFIFAPLAKLGGPPQLPAV